MHSLIRGVEQQQMKKKVTDVKSGDTVRVHQKIKEGSKERVQVFEGLVIATRRQNSLTSSITVRRVASGVGVEKTFLLHSPLVQKIDVVKRSTVRRDKLNYMRDRSGKSARLSSVAFDRDKVNAEQENARVSDDSVEETENEAKTEDAKEAPAERPEAKEDAKPDKQLEAKAEDSKENTPEEKQAEKADDAADSKQAEDKKE